MFLKRKKKNGTKFPKTNFWVWHCITLHAVSGLVPIGWRGACDAEVNPEANSTRCHTFSANALAERTPAKGTGWMNAFPWVGGNLKKLPPYGRHSLITLRTKEDRVRQPGADRANMWDGTLALLQTNNSVTIMWNCWHPIRNPHLVTFQAETSHGKIGWSCFWFVLLHHWDCWITQIILFFFQIFEVLREYLKKINRNILRQVWGICYIIITKCPVIG